MKMKRLTIILLALLLSVCSILFACDADDAKKLEGLEPEFVEGASTEVELGTGVVIAEVVKIVKGVDYEITLTDGDGNKKDLTKKVYWSAEVPGKYTITYSLISGKHKKTNTFGFEVVCQPLTFEYTPTKAICNVGDVLDFEKYFIKINYSTNSYYDYELVMDSVDVGGKVTSLSGKTSYTFAEKGDHLFKFHIVTEDGQTKEGKDTMSVTMVSKELSAYLKTIDATIYGVEEADLTKIVLQKGVHAKGLNKSLSKNGVPHDLPYIAFSGEYGLGSFVKVDFTGKNIPAISFFRKEYTKSVFDSTNGIIMSVGFNKNIGTPANETVSKQINVYGPKMIDDITTSVLTLGDGSSAYAGSYTSLNETTKYRLVVGFTEGTVANTLTFNMILVNLDNSTIVNSISTSTNVITGEGVTLDDNYLKGNIVIYGNYAYQTTFDKVYGIITNKTFTEICDEIFNA